MKTYVMDVHFEILEEIQSDYRSAKTKHRSEMVKFLIILSR